MSALPKEARQAVVETLVRQRERDGYLPTIAVASMADLCGATPRTLWRWVSVAKAPTYERPAYQLTEADLAVYAKWHGNVAAVWRELHQGRAGSPTQRTLQRAFREQLNDADRAMACSGVAARRAEELNVAQRYSARNELWVADHSQLDILVMPTRSTRPDRPWSTLFIDAYSRAITGWVLSMQPTHATVLAALRRAVLPKYNDEAQRSICGRPDMLQTDNGLEFTAERVAAAVHLMEGQARTVRGYSPQLNGLVERLHRTMDQTWLSGQPFYTSSARQHDHQHTRPLGVEPMSFDDFVIAFGDWVRVYNTERPHSALGGRTPLEVWNADQTQLVIPAEDHLDWMLDAPVRRKVREQGIELGGLWYSHPDLHEYVGRHVDVRVPVNETHFVHCSDGDTRICRATPVETWTGDDRLAFIQGRQRSRQRLNAARRNALAVQAGQFDARRALDDPAQQAARDELTASDGNLLRSSETGLLDLDLDDAA